MGRILRPYNPLVYPGGRLPGFDPSHPAASGAAAAVSGISIGDNFVNIRTGQPFTSSSGISTGTIDGTIGPSSAVVHTVSFDTPAALPAGDLTQAAIMVMTSQPAFGGIVGTTPSNGMLLFTNGTDLGAYWGSGLDAFPGVAFPIGVPYFFAATVKSGVGVFLVITDLKTGIVKSAFISDAAAVPSVSTGLRVGATFNGSSQEFHGPIAAVMCSAKYVATPAMLAWAADPWSFWYPPVRQPVLFSGLSGPAAGGSSTLTAAGGTFTLTGEATTFKLQDPETAGAFTLTGEASLFEQFLAASSGSFTLTGEAAAFFLSGGLVAAGGTFTLTGEAALFEQFLASAAGAFVLTGGAATLTWVLPAAGAGTFTLTGEPATFKEALTSAAGAFTETGFPALLGAPAQAFVVSFGTFTFTGFAAIELLSSGWRNAIPAVTQWSSATKPNSNWTLEPPVVPWSRG